MIVKNELNLKCINYSISQIFSLIITLLSLTLKFPQIITIIRKKSAQGISISSAYLDFFNVYFLFMYSYKNKLNLKVIVEYFLVSLQNLLIIFLYWYYEINESKDTNSFYVKKYLRLIGTLLSVLILYCGLFTNIYPEWIFVSFALTNVPFVLFSRIFQLKDLIKTKNPGSLSLSSFTMRYVKNFMQAFYLFIQVGDYILIFNQIYNGTLSLTVYMFILYYSRKINYRKVTKKDQSKVKYL